MIALGAEVVARGPSAERTIPQRRKAMRAALKEARRLEARHTGQLTVRVLDDYSRNLPDNPADDDAEAKS